LARTILLADDSVTAQNMGRRILTDAGYEVITVNNGSAALKKIAEHKPDLIVLDVYMPGYGGLEVCNRLKEARETARIPVLLTVGKLEPFKPDEARKARADAFLVKPFEASELLTALTKLEDKIVPQAQPHKPGRFAKALASIEEAEAEEAFGNVETGWKNRLKIPPPTPAKPKPLETPVQDEIPPSDLGRSEDFKPSEPASRFERPIPAGLPADITPEEIAAITAAAATVSGKKETQAPEMGAPEAETKAEVPPETVSEPTPSPTATVETVATEEPIATLASVAAESSEPAVSERPETESRVEEHHEALPTLAASSEAPAQVEAPVAQLAEPEIPTPELKAEPLTTEADDKPWVRDAEVLAAIASLVPSAIIGDEHAEIRERETVEVAAVAAIAAVGSFKASVPRWIAEAVPLLDEDSSANLELEMQRAQATSQAIAQPVSATAVAVEEMRIETPEPAAIDNLEPPAPPSPQEDIPPAAYAAAAASGSGAEGALVVEATMASTAPAESPAVNEPGEKLREAEMAAAWENWKHIRESIVGEQLTSQIAEVAAAGLQASQAGSTEDSQTVEETASSDESGDGSGDSEEPEEIANIVDSVLAELKPKLMEEIARKMSKDKDKKGKAKKNKK